VVRLISSDGKQVGVMPLNRALETAENDELDLVEIGPIEDPVVCRLLDYGKFKFDAKRKKKEAQREQKQNQVTTKEKEVRLSPRIGEHDLQVKIGKAVEFLSKRYKVLVSMQLKRREYLHKDMAIEVMQLFIQRVGGEISDSQQTDGILPGFVFNSSISSFNNGKLTCNMWMTQ